MESINLKHKKEEKKIPNLRFPGFEGELRENRLDMIFSIFNGYAFSSEHAQNYGCRWVKIADVGINKMKYNAISFLPMDYQDKFKKFVLREGDFVVALTRPILNGELKIARINKDFDGALLNQRVGKLNSTNVIEYVYYLLQRSSLIVRIENRIAGTDPPNLSPYEIGSLKTYIPSLPEQQKIASFLSAVDQKIQQLTRKKKLLEQYKKGVMQKIFSQEIRFKPDNAGFDSAQPAGESQEADRSRVVERSRNYPDWEEKRLGEFASVTMGQSPDSKSYNHNANGILLIQGNADIVNRLTNPRQWTSEPTKTCEVGDLILTVRAPVGSISKSIHNACIGRGVCSIKSKNNSDIEFLYQILLDHEPKWVRLEQGSTFTAVSRNDIKSIKINLPILPEQQKISLFLSNIDNKIESIQTQINQTQKFKKGLLQQMFV